jgi:basic membrane protein A and related proteins
MRTKKAGTLIIALMLAVVMALPLFAGGQKEADEKTAGEAEEKDTVKVAMAASGARGDEGIFDSGWKGLQEAEADFGVEVKVFEGDENPSLYAERLISAAEWADLIFVNPGYQFGSDLKEVLQAYPNKMFVYADGITDMDAPNLISVAYRENEGSYPFGVMAAMMTTRTDMEGINADKMVGIVGAMDIPTINNFVAGFKQGAASIDKEVKVEVRYAGAFDDPAKGLELAKSLYDAGADIVYNVAATTGLGVLKAAEETGRYAIGVDVNQDEYHPGHVAGSMLKRVDISFYDVTERYINGKLTGDEVLDFGIKRGWVGPTYSDQMKKVVPADIIEKMQEVQKKIVDGELDVDSTR